MAEDDSEKLVYQVAKAAVDSALEPFKEQVTNLFSPFTKEMGLLLALPAQLWRLKAKVIIVQKATKFLEERKVVPQQVPLKLLSPILEYGCLEEDDTMTGRWAALLASAADPNHKEAILPSFPEVLKQLSPQEVAILEKAYGVLIDSRGVQPLSDWQKMNVPIQDNFGDATSDFFIVAIDNLKRLDLLRTLPPGFGVSLIPHSIVLTRLGFAFVSACRPPGNAGGTIVLRNYTPEILP